MAPDWKNPMLKVKAQKVVLDPLEPISIQDVRAGCVQPTDIGIVPGRIPALHCIGSVDRIHPVDGHEEQSWLVYCHFHRTGDCGGQLPGIRGTAFDRMVAGWYVVHRPVGDSVDPCLPKFAHRRRVR